jgi:hypothetical protein
VEVGQKLSCNINFYNPLPFDLEVSLDLKIRYFNPLFFAVRCDLLACFDSDFVFFPLCSCAVVTLT